MKQSCQCVIECGKEYLIKDEGNSEAAGRAAGADETDAEDDSAAGGQADAGCEAKLALIVILGDDVADAYAEEEGPAAATQQKASTVTPRPAVSAGARIWATKAVADTLRMDSAIDSRGVYYVRVAWAGQRPLEYFF
ncbi:hypothetical protein HPB52_002103 [Rhipicephalus sanguineus]|uniref:Uncharacterized protein n=1 Tax=Rhipicephalus sanguineus TaxID=34632 RepID=A0A9D4SPP6_RHISA|nr:hypothetical protein HPB52_002103 [Rhipicephalus sanguineus]